MNIIEFINQEDWGYSYDELIRYELLRMIHGGGRRRRFVTLGFFTISNLEHK